MANKWKVIAIIFIVLFLAETSFIVWASWLYMDEEQKTLECYYEICGDYPEAQYESNLCTCYDYDIIGNLEPVEYEVMK